jgi:ribosomal protein L11 methyltransferase
MAAAPWTALVVRVPAALEEALVGRLAWCLQGERRLDAATPGAAADEVELWLYLHSPAAEGAALAQAGEIIARAGLDPAACGLRARVVEDERWVERYQASLRPFDLGRRFRVYPAGRVDEPAGPRRPLLLVPGRAFGTGEHPTTRLCAVALEQRVVPGQRWVDVGCGTAILAIVARGCGAREVLALDHDAEAVEVAREVLAVNGVDGVALRVGSCADAGAGAWDGVAVNISAPFLVEQAATLAGLVRPGGTLVASGFLAAGIGEVRAAFEAAGTNCAATACDDPWALAVFRRG